MQSSLALTDNTRIVVVHGLLTGTTGVVVSAMLWVVIAFWVRFWSPVFVSGMMVNGVAAALLLVSLALLLHRGSRAKRREIASAADRRAATLEPIRLTALDTARWFLPERLRGLAALACNLAARGYLTVARLSALVAVGVLVLPSLVIVGNMGVAVTRDWLMVSLAILGPALIVRTQLIAVGAGLVRAQAERPLNDVMFPG